jgi:hypothetical protein
MLYRHIYHPTTTADADATAVLYYFCMARGKQDQQPEKGEREREREREREIDIEREKEREREGCCCLLLSPPMPQACSRSPDLHMRHPLSATAARYKIDGASLINCYLSSPQARKKHWREEEDIAQKGSIISCLLKPKKGLHFILATFSLD